jgi:multiple sugar transport system substrate-binding protein
MTQHEHESKIGLYTRRTAMGALAAAGVGFALFGPRGAKQARDGRIVLDYWEKWTGHEGRAMQKVVDRFNETIGAQKGIRVRYLVTAGVDQKAMIAIAGGDPPDVIGMYNYNVPQFAETGAIRPLDEFGELSPRQDQYAKAVWPILTHPDPKNPSKMRVWATPNTGGTLALYYNKEAFKAVGLDPARPPRTIAEWDEYCEKLDRNDAKGEIEQAGFMHTEPGWWSWIWGYQFGGNLYDAAAEMATINEARNVRAYEWLASYGARLGPTKSERFKSGFATAYSSSLNGFLDNKVAMVVQGPWLANVINEFRPNMDYGVAAVPVLDELYDPARPIGLVESDILVVPTEAKHPEASMEFIRYTQTQPIAEELATAHMKNTVLSSASEAFVSKHPNRGVAVHNMLANSERGFICPRTRVWPQFKKGMDENMQAIWKGSLSAASALGDVQAIVQGAVDRAAVARKRRMA